MLDWQITRYRLELGKESKFETYAWIPRWRALLQYTWLNDTPVNVLRHALENLDNAYSQFFRRVKEGKAGKAGFPKFKRKGRHETFTASQSVEADYEGQRIHLPMVGWVRCRLHHNIGNVKRITIYLHGNGKVYASILYDEVQSTRPLPAQVDLGRIVGVDMGLIDFLTTDLGETVAPPKFLFKHLHRLAQLQRGLSRAKKGSNNCLRRLRRVAACTRKIADSRHFHRHLTAFQLVHGMHSESQAPQAIALEGLKIRNMTKNHRLARAIMDAGWSDFGLAVKHQCTKQGVYYVEVEPRNTSKTCSHCQHVFADVLGLGIRNWECLKCHTHHHRDQNAGAVIRQRGIKVLMAQGVPIAFSEGKPEYSCRTLPKGRVLDIVRPTAQAERLLGVGKCDNAVSQSHRKMVAGLGVVPSQMWEYSK